MRHRFSSSVLLLSVILSLGFGKWGAWIGFPSYGVFLIDILFMGSILLRFLPRFQRPGDLLFYFLPCSLLILIYFFTASNGSRVTQIRDLVPFIYLLFVPAIARTLEGVDFTRIIQALRLGTILHLAWSSLVTLGLLQPFRFFPSLFGAQIFEKRWDLAGLVYAIGILSWSSFRSQKLERNSIAIIAFVIAGGLQASRAGMISVAFAIIFVLLKERVNGYGSKGYLSRIVLIAILGFAVVTSASLLSSQLPGSSLSRLGVFGDDAKVIQSAGNTARARSEARKLMMNWTFTQNKQYFGFGPGVEIVSDSGAINYLSGAKDVRAPHNWFVGLFARFGILGTAVWALLVTYSAFGRSLSPEIAWLGRCSIFLILVVSTLGVIMESPFGSLPFSFFLGMLMANKNRISGVGK